MTNTGTNTGLIPGRELIEIVRQEMSSEWSREFIEGLDDNLKC